MPSINGSEGSGTIKVIATDIDGTLLDSNHRLSPRNEAAIRAAMERGLQVIFATGKTRASTLDLTTTLGLKTPGVYVQGLVLYNSDDQIVHQRLMDDEVVQEICDFIDGTDYTGMAYSGMTIYASHDGPYIDRMTRYHEPRPTVIASLHSLVGTTPINKVQFFDTPERIMEIKRQVEPMLHGRAVLTMPAFEIVEILPLGASKGAGLKFLMEHMGLDPATLLALGDGENDIEMLQMAKVGVAMGNAMPKLKAAADHITRSNDEDGVAEAIERFALR
jgi:Cof subfamily protein (haloacid dehalogenase superfamily)